MQAAAVWKVYVSKVNLTVTCKNNQKLLVWIKDKLQVQANNSALCIWLAVKK
jgi:hypothetical protein